MSISYGGDNIQDTDGGVLRPISSVMRNRIINGAMVIDQRNAGASVTPSADGYLLDRWSYSASQASKFTWQQNKGSVTLPIGFSNYLGGSVASAVTIGSTDYFRLVQPIEGYNIADLGWGTANAKTVTLSFQVYSSLTGTFGGALTALGYARSYPFTYSIPVANTWTTVSITVAGDGVGGSGNWATTNGIGLHVVFGLGVGSTYSGTAGSWSSSAYISATGATSVVGTSGATFYLTGCQLEVGSSATGFEYRQYGTELALCQRYCIVYGAIGWVAGSSFSTNRVLSGLPIQTAMRSTPTITGTSNGVTWFSNGAAQTSSAVSYTGQSNNGSFQADVTVTATSGNSGVINVASGLTLSAEL